MESSSKLKQRLSRMFRSACKPSASSDRRNAVDPVFVAAVDCGGCRRVASAPHPAAAQVCKSGGKKERRVRETGGYYETGEWEGRACPPASPASPSKSSFPASYYYHCIHGDDAKRELCPSRSKATKKKNTVRLRSNAYGFTSSSSTETDDEDGDGFFSSEELREESTTTTFFSSRSFSSDSSEFYASAKKNKKAAAQQRSRRRGSNRRETSYWPPGGCKGGFRPMVAAIDDGKKKKKNKKEKNEKGAGFAVAKRSRDPYGDFRTSMVEMMMERQLFGAQELERLLHSYLALNSSHLHPLILQAFSDIWLLLFGR